MMLRSLISLLMVLVFSSGSYAESRIALLIGNQAYSERAGSLKNPHNDIALVGTALEKVGFKVTRIKDAGYRRSTPRSSATSSRCGARAKIPLVLSITRVMALPIPIRKSTTSSQLTSPTLTIPMSGRIPSI
jgi:hypothetical protein